MINDHIFYVGVCPNTGESIITPLPFYTDLPAEKKTRALTDLLVWLVEERNKHAMDAAIEGEPGKATVEIFELGAMEVELQHESGR